MIFPSFLNFRFRVHNIFVRLLSSCMQVFRYSHDLMAKKMVPISSQAIALSCAETDSSISFCKTIIGNAFCFFFCPSWFLQPRNCSCKRKQVLLSRSSLGYCLLLDLKTCVTYETVELTIPSTRCLVGFDVKAHSRTAWAKAEMRMFC